MRKRVAMLLVVAAALVASGCHFHGFYGHPHGMPPGQAKKVVKPKPGKVWVAVPVR